MSGVDPYVDWALGPGAEDYFGDDPNTRMAVLLWLDKTTTPRKFEAGEPFVAAKGRALWKDAIKIPEFYKKLHDPEPKPKSKPEEVRCTAFVKREFFRLLQASPGAQKLLSQLHLSLPLDTEATPFAKASRRRRKR
jgi:hypothetical protein